jgi:hypothetical protein
VPQAAHLPLTASSNAQHLLVRAKANFSSDEHNRVRTKIEVKDRTNKHRAKDSAHESDPAAQVNPNPNLDPPALARLPPTTTARTDVSAASRKTLPRDPPKKKIRPPFTLKTSPPV